MFNKPSSRLGNKGTPVGGQCLKSKIFWTLMWSQLSQHQSTIVVKKKHTIVATPSTIVYEVLTIVVWSVFLYPCLYVAVTCPPMNLTENMLYISNISVPGDAYYHVNDTIQLGCVRGYEIQPSAVYECQKTGSWNVSSVPSCKRKYQLPNACS